MSFWKCHIPTSLSILQWPTLNSPVYYKAVMKCKSNISRNSIILLAKYKLYKYNFKISLVPPFVGNTEVEDHNFDVD